MNLLMSDKSRILKLKTLIQILSVVSLGCLILIFVLYLRFGLLDRFFEILSFFLPIMSCMLFLIFITYALRFKFESTSRVMPTVIFGLINSRFFSDSPKNMIPVIFGLIGGRYLCDFIYNIHYFIYYRFMIQDGIESVHSFLMIAIFILATVNASRVFSKKLLSRLLL